MSRKTPSKYNQYDEFKRNNPGVDLGLENSRNTQAPSGGNNEAAWIREWETSPELRAEFGDRREIWLAYCEAQETISVKTVRAGDCHRFTEEDSKC